MIEKMVATKVKNILSMKAQYPLLFPVEGINADIASQKLRQGTQWGGYLKRATSRMRTASALGLYAPIGEKCPFPDWIINKRKARQSLTIWILTVCSWSFFQMFTIMLILSNTLTCKFRDIADWEIHRIKVRQMTCPSTCLLYTSPSPRD